MVYYLNNCLETFPNLYINWKKPQQILMDDQENNLSNFYDKKKASIEAFFFFKNLKKVIKT